MPVPDSAVFARLRGLVAIDPTLDRSNRTIDEVFTGTALGAVPVGNREDVRAAFDRARIEQQRWAGRAVAERAAVVERFRALVLESLDYLMDVIQAETGKARWAAQ